MKGVLKAKLSPGHGLCEYQKVDSRFALGKLVPFKGYLVVLLVLRVERRASSMQGKRSKHSSASSVCCQ